MGRPGGPGRHSGPGAGPDVTVGSWVEDCSVCVPGCRDTEVAPDSCLASAERGRVSDPSAGSEAGRSSNFFQFLFAVEWTRPRPFPSHRLGPSRAVPAPLGSGLRLKEWRDPGHSPSRPGHVRVPDRHLEEPKSPLGPGARDGRAGRHRAPLRVAGPARAPFSAWPPPRPPAQGWGLGARRGGGGGGGRGAGPSRPSAAIPRPSPVPPAAAWGQRAGSAVRGGAGPGWTRGRGRRRTGPRRGRAASPPPSSPPPSGPSEGWRLSLARGSRRAAAGCERGFG